MAKVERVPLGEVAEINPPIRREAISDPGLKVSFVAMAGVSEVTGSVLTSDVRTAGECRKGYTAFARDDVLVAKITPCFENGKIVIADIPYAFGFGSTEFHVVRPIPDKVDPRFLLHVLRVPNFRVQGERRMTGSAGQRRVPADFLSTFEIPLPTLPLQRRIAEVLDRAEALRAKRRAALAQLDTLTQSLFLDLFGDPATNPKGWPRVEFRELLANIDSGWSPKCLDRPVTGEEWGILKLGAVTWCEYNPAENKALPLDVEPDATIEVKPGDLLFARKNTYELVAACALVRETPPRLLMSDLIFRLRLRPDPKVDSCFLHQLLIYPTKRRDIQKLAGGSAGSMPNIAKARLETTLIEVPPIELQREFAQRVTAVDALKTAQRASLAELDALFATLQHRAFKGEL